MDKTDKGILAGCIFKHPFLFLAITFLCVSGFVSGTAANGALYSDAPTLLRPMLSGAWPRAVLISVLTSAMLASAGLSGVLFPPLTVFTILAAFLKCFLTGFFASQLLRTYGLWGGIRALISLIASLAMLTALILSFIYASSRRGPKIGSAPDKRDIGRLVVLMLIGWAIEFICAAIISLS